MRIDNLVQIAHNVRVGAHSAMAAFSGVSGSTVIGKRCMFAGKSATVGHITVCDDVTIWGRCTVSKDITEPGVLASPRGRCVANTLGALDSMAMEADGTAVVAALRQGLLVVRPDETHEFIAVDGPLITNVAFGGDDMQTAYITESALGSLIAMPWPRPGHAPLYGA